MFNKTNKATLKQMTLQLRYFCSLHYIMLLYINI